jgi:hypothetical protein
VLKAFLLVVVWAERMAELLVEMMAASRVALTA